MTIFAPALTGALKLIADEAGGIGDLKRKSAIETRIHNFLVMHDLRDQIPAIEEWFADLLPEEIEDLVSVGPSHPMFNMAPAFTKTLLDSFAVIC